MGEENKLHYSITPIEKLPYIYITQYLGNSLKNLEQCNILEENSCT